MKILGVKLNRFFLNQCSSDPLIHLNVHLILISSLQHSRHERAQRSIMFIFKCTQLP
jgi:hypothetical protein